MGQYARMLTEPVREAVFPLLPAARRGELLGVGLARGWGFEPWWEQVCLPRMARQAHATHLLCPANTGPMWPDASGLRRIMVIHDLIYLQPSRELPWSRSPYQNLGRVYRRYVVPRAALHADQILTVSSYTRDRLLEELGLPGDKVHVVPNTVRADWFTLAPEPDENRQPYLLCVGGEAPSKNLNRLIEAFALLTKQGDLAHLRLVIAGVKPPFHGGLGQWARQFGLDADRLAFLGEVSTADLQSLYRRAWGCVMPSLYEGFGIPALEALASGTPLACSNSTSLPEVAGGCAYLFDPRRVDDMATALALMCRASGRMALARAGQVHARERFHPDAVEKLARQFWQEVLS